MRIIITLVLMFILPYSFALVNQNICIIAQNPEDSVFETWLENEIAKNTNINIFYSFKYENLDPMAFMFQQKLSGLIIIKNSNLTIYDTKGQLTNLTITPKNIENISKLILTLFPPKEKEKIIKEIEEIDYVSQLEEPIPKHSISLGLGMNISGLEILSSSYWYHENSDSKSRFLPVIEYSLNTRYFYFSLGLGISDRWKISSQLGVWLFKSFMLIGIETSLINLNYNLESFVRDPNVSLLSSTTINNKQCSLTLLNFIPIIKFKFSKNDILTITPIIAVPIVIKTENLTLQDDSKIRSSVKYIGIMVSMELGIISNLSLGYTLEILAPPIISTGYLNENNKINFRLSMYSESVLFFKYKI